MALTFKKPTTPTRRHTALVVDRAISKSRPLIKSLMKSLPYKAGRNTSGKLTVRHRGGRGKRQYRDIDFLRENHDVSGIVVSIEYDPNRSANIALINYKDGDKRYILSPDGLKIGDEVISGEKAPIRTGNALPLKNIPEGTSIYNLECRTGDGGKLLRSSGTFAKVIGK